MRNRILVPTLLVALVTFQSPTWGWQTKKNQTTTDIAKADGDYAYQGEYIGKFYRADLIGLQVVAMGDGEFIGVKFEGGLPGAGWDRQRKTNLAGTLSDGVVRLTGSDITVVVHPEHAEVSEKGQATDRLRKIRRISSTLDLAPPSNAKILFGGSNTEHLEGAKVSDDGLLMAGVTTKDPVHDFQLHIEFRLPYKPHARGQGRGNSGVYIQRRYEVQVLDSFGLEGVANECGGLYRQQRPDLNMCLPPLSWQTYDISFRAARWAEDGKKKLENARLTVLHNGEPIHDRREIPAKTGAGRPESPELLPIYLQDHGNPVAFRNVWIVPGDPFAKRKPAACRRYSRRR